MARFLDGPASGVSMDLRRCPMYLRVVKSDLSALSLGDARRKRRGWDALDQPDDTPEAGEVVHVYEAVPLTGGVVFVRPGGRYEYADYRHRPDVDGEALRDTAAWREWATAQRAIEVARSHRG